MSLDPSRMEAASPLIRPKAKRMCSRRGFTQSDRPDIEQELWQHLVAQSPKFNVSRSWEKFVSYILDKRCISIHRDRFAEMRSPDREECSLDDAALDCDGRAVPRHELVAESSSVPQRLRELERDVAEVLAQLSDVHRAIALGLVTGTVNSLANELGIPRSAVERHIDEIREVFEDAGLREYL